MKNILEKAFKASLPIMGGYVVLGIGFGVVLTTSGYNILWALAMSIFIYAGSLQFVGIGLLTSGASLLTVALTSLMVNARHLFYGLSMLDKYRGAGAKKPYMIFGLTDETYSLVCEGRKELSTEEFHLYAFFVSLFDQIYWVAGSVLGALLGNFIPFDTTGIDFALTALFIVVFVQQWIDNENHTPAIIGVGASVVSILIFGRSQFLIPAMLIITIALCFIGAREVHQDDK